MEGLVSGKPGRVEGRLLSCRQGRPPRPGHATTRVSKPAAAAPSYPPWHTQPLAAKTAVLDAAVGHTVDPESGHIVDHHAPHFELCMRLLDVIELVGVDTGLDAVVGLIGASAAMVWVIIVGSFPGMCPPERHVNRTCRHNGIWTTRTLLSTAQPASSHSSFHDAPGRCTGHRRGLALAEP